MGFIDQSFSIGGQQVDSAISFLCDAVYMKVYLLSLLFNQSILRLIKMRETFLGGNPSYQKGWETLMTTGLDKINASIKAFFSSSCLFLFTSVSFLLCVCRKQKHDYFDVPKFVNVLDFIKVCLHTNTC